jgi:16S rRNA (adenine1518-N6/adenine1519-N6)-dimethyltransferase
MRKKFGQNFLINEGARLKLIEALSVRAGDIIWEVGPGLGSMTRLLLDRGAMVTVFEIDRGFTRMLNIIFAREIAEKRLTVVEGDVLKTWPVCAAGIGETPLSLLGNLPYGIAGTLLGDFIEKGLIFSRAVVTVQKEVAARIVARSGDKDYSSLTVLFSGFYTAQKICSMKGSFFYPPPNVDSTGICFYPKERAAVEVPPVFFPLLRALFSQRRKTVYNNLYHFVVLNGVPAGFQNDDAAAFCERTLSLCAIGKNMRAENLEAGDFRRIAEFLAEHGYKGKH